MLERLFRHDRPRLSVAALALIGALLAGCVTPVPTGVDAAGVFERIRTDPVALAAFMKAFPKGGDIHHHLIGAPTPDMFMAIGAEEGFCIDPDSLDVTAGPCLQPAIALSSALERAALVERLRDSWSMRQFERGDAAAPNHFFGVFPKIWPLVDNRGIVLAELKKLAANENLLYLETQLQAPAPTDALRAVAMTLESDSVLALRDQLQATGDLGRQVQAATDTLRQYDKTAARRLSCDADPRPAPCDVIHRYQVYALRILPNPMVYADMILAFELAASMPEVVGVNVVGFEGDANALANYALHMRALGELKRAYPDVKLALHAGEITSREADEAALRSHVPDAVYIAGAARIGHGNAIAHSASRKTLLEDLAFTGTSVEVSLTSNELLLGLAGDEHHLKLLMDAGVGVTLNTDDAGIFVTDLSREYMLAATRYAWLSYADFKRLSRRSLEAAFIEGPSLWRDGNVGMPVAQCAAMTSDSCNALVGASARARLQRRLETRFTAFERRVLAGEF